MFNMNLVKEIISFCIEASLSWLNYDLSQYG